ncbi:MULTISPECIES: DUF389 domain-containing protein [unclassified Aureispira]|uniref:DUF389 domain-containing protein n=1 Tax=unclassified Aureispira TaxID=2649989 RepID=UPI000695F34F|nr:MULTISPECIES: DUF389 domain-containing protein [unclassified Aureispira]WMX15924.1 DUF389 domain-containing protein [Aureispira sp. CCB-E]
MEEKNTSNNKNKPLSSQPDDIAIGNSTISKLISRGVHELKELFSLHLDTDEAGTIESIRKSIEFKGGNLWGLIFAAFIASIGLNMNSGAVVIGAMLISPLMGPIVGIGYALATNDFDTLKYALQNLVIFIVGSILSAVVYFSVSPIKSLTDQLEARTYPTFYDVMIAICGGAIGIVASSRFDRGNAIPGVAIATALMPPLCTVGYGIATGQWAYAGGAFYLFFINSVFIAGTSLIFVRALQFPKKEFLDPVREQRYKMILVIIVVFTIIPSLWTGYNLVQRELFNSKAALFERKVEDYHLEKGVIVDQKTDYRRDTPAIILITSGGIRESDKDNLLHEMNEVGLGYAKLIFREGNLDVEVLLAEVQSLQSKFTTIREEYSGMLKKLYEDNEIVLKNKTERIKFLEGELSKYQIQSKRTTKPVNDIALEFSTLYPDAVEISYNELIKMNTESRTLDTLPTVVINWEGRRMRSEQKERIANFFQTRMKLDTISVIIY